MQQALKPASGVAGAQIVAAELFAQLDVAMNDAPSAFADAFYFGFPRGRTSAAYA
jgi:hypothetical protein